MKQKPLLSVVITACTTERINDIYELLDSIKNQTCKDVETIFIAERSQELYNGVDQYSKAIGLSGFKIIFTEDKLGLGGARSFSVNKTEAEIVAFIDDDVILYPEWAEEMIKSYQDDSVIGVSGLALPLWKDKQLDWLPKNYYWLISCTDWTNWNEPTEARSLWGMNMSVRREAFEKAGTFLPSLGYHQPMAEDLEFSLRVRRRTGKKLLFNPKVKVWHKVYAYRINLRFVASRAHHIGISRRILRATCLKEQATFKMERKVINGIIKIFLSLPVEFFKNPAIAWKMFTMSVTIATFAMKGFLFPGKGMAIAKEIQGILAEPEV